MTQLTKLIANNPNLKNGLRIELINKALIKNKGNAKSVLQDTLEIGEILAKSVDYFKSAECKQIFKQEKVILTIEEFLFVEFGMKKSWAYKLIKGSKSKNELNKFCASNPDTFGLDVFLKWLKPETDKTEKAKIILSVKYDKISATIDEKGIFTTNSTRTELKKLIVRLTAELDKM